MMAEQFDGARLAEALATGQPDQLEAAFDRHFDAMILLVRSFSGASGAEVSRLLEAVWASAPAAFARERPRGFARAWLFNRLLDASACAAGTAGEEVLPEFMPAGDPWEDFWKDYPAPWQGGADGWEHTERGRALLEHAIARLPPLERVALVTRDIDGWTIPEVSALAHLGPSRVREVLFTARVRVRAAIDAMLRPQPMADGHG